MSKETARPDPDRLIGDMLGAAANAQLDSVLRDVLLGYIDEMGGGRAVGRELAAISKDEQVQPNVKVNAFGHVMKLAMLFRGNDDPNNSLLSIEDIERENEALEQVAKEQRE